MNKIIQEDLEYITSSEHNLPWNNFNNSTVLIAGSNSYLSSYLIETLLYLNDKYDKNIKIIGITRNKEKSILKYHHHKDRKDLTFIYRDVTDPIIACDISHKLKLYESKEKRYINYIFHAASQAIPKHYYLDPVGTLSANTLGTINLLEFVKNQNAKNQKEFKGFLYFSSGMVYGKVEDKDVPMNEDCYRYLDPTDYKSCYAESKRMGENICASYYHQYNIPTKIVRISHVFGPGMDLNDERVYHSFLSDVLNNRDKSNNQGIDNCIIMKSDGSSTRDFIYIADAAQAFLTVLSKGKCGESYNVGTGKETSILELANILRDLSGQIIPEKKIEIIQQVERNEDKSRSCFDISKIKTLGWEPVYDLVEGSKRTIKYYQLKSNNK